MDIIIFLTLFFVDFVGAFLTLSSMSILYSLAGSLATAECILQTVTCIMLSGLWTHPVACTVLVSCISVPVAMWTMKQFDTLVSQFSNMTFKAEYGGFPRIRRLSVVSILAVFVIAPLALVMARSTSLRATASGYDLDLRTEKYSGSLALPLSVLSLVDLVSFVKHGARGTQLWKCVDEYGSVSLHSRWTVPMEFYMTCTEVKIPPYERTCNATDGMERAMHLVMHVITPFSLALQDTATNIIAKFNGSHTPTLYEATNMSIQCFIALVFLNLLLQLKFFVERHAVTRHTRETKEDKRAVVDTNYHLAHENNILRQVLRAKIVKLQQARRSKHAMRLMIEKRNRTQRDVHRKRQKECESKLAALQNELEDAKAASRETSPIPESVVSSREGSPVAFNFDDTASNASDMTTATDVEEEELRVNNSAIKVDCAKATESEAINYDATKITTSSDSVIIVPSMKPIPIATALGAPSLPAHKMLPPQKRLAVSSSPFYLLRATMEVSERATKAGNVFETLDVNEVD